jgi:hypothetical protein
MKTSRNLLSQNNLVRKEKELQMNGMISSKVSIKSDNKQVSLVT